MNDFAGERRARIERHACIPSSLPFPTPLPATPSKSAQTNRNKLRNLPRISCRRAQDNVCSPVSLPLPLPVNSSLARLTQSWSRTVDQRELFGSSFPPPNRTVPSDVSTKETFSQSARGWARLLCHQIDSYPHIKSFYDHPVSHPGGFMARLTTSSLSIKPIWACQSWDQGFRWATTTAL